MRWDILAMPNKFVIARNEAIVAIHYELCVALKDYD